MKRMILVTFVCLIASLSSMPAQERKFEFSLNAMPLVQALDMYAQMTGDKLIKDSRVGGIQRSIRLHGSALTKAEGAKLLAKALLEQAGIVITPLGDMTTSVTYNDALPIK